MGEPVGARPSVEDLLAVLDVARELAASPELQPLLERVEASVLKVLDCERVGVFVLDAAAGELAGRVATGQPGLRFPSDKGIAGEVLRTGVIINLPDAHLDPRFNPEVDRKTGYRTRSLLTLPLRGWDDRPVGVLQALNKRCQDWDALDMHLRFDARDEAIASALAIQAGVAIQRQLLLDQAEERRKLGRDLDVARRIQQGLMPRKPPRVPGYDLAGWNLPADQTGGDFFDLQQLEDNTLALTVADVAGHGIGPALLVAECRAFIRATLAQARDPAKLVELVDLLLSEDLPEDRFITLFFALLEPVEGRIRHLSAGHGPVLVYRAATNQFEELPPQGCPLGVAPELPRGESAELILEPGDLLAVFTDGFIEWANPAGTQFGTERLGQALVEGRDRPAAALIGDIHAQLVAFADGTPQPDDLTAVILRRQPA